MLQTIYKRQVKAYLANMKFLLSIALLVALVTISQQSLVNPEQEDELIGVSFYFI